MDEPTPQLNLDAAGIFWVSWCGVWTLLVAVGMGFLWYRRDTPLLRIRGLNLTLAAIGFLHTYWMAVQMAYIADPFPPQAEYWIMGIYLPFGIALFHASNARFLYIAGQQRRKFVRKGDHQHGGWAPATVFGRLRRLSHTQKMLVVIGMGMGLQFILTVLMYLLSRKFHPSFGIPGTEVGGSPWDVKDQQARGWEWWPSIIWQFFWSWIVAPVVLWRARSIHDTLGWRTQTLACCLAGLPATPMWLIALYVPGMSGVNRYWIPPQWIAISIVFLEIFSIFLPCWQVWRHQSLRQDTIDMIAAWEAKRHNHGGEGSSILGATSVLGRGPSQETWKAISAMEKASTTGSVGTAYSGESMLSMGALEHMLEHNPDPLRQFSALKDFSGENVAFLTAVAEWKSRYRAVAKGEAALEAYNKALHIYVDFISPKDAEFPINISFQVKTGLEAIFEKPARVLYGDRGLTDSPATPFAPGADWPRGAAASARLSHASERPIIGSRADSNTDVELRSMTDRFAYWGEVPAAFDAAVFDKAETSIKYLVLTNTWPKFVRDRRESGISLTSCGSEGRGGSFVSRVSKILSCEY